MSKKLLPANILSPGASLSEYVQGVSGIPVLTREEERSIADDLYYNQSIDAARKLVLAHLRFVVYIARSYSGYGLSQADLIQEGNVGLMKAVKRFNPEHDVRLVSFAVHWIKAEIHEYILRNWRIVKIATTKAQRKLFFNLRKNKKNLAWLNNNEVTDIANSLNVKEKDVRQMESRLSSSDLSFDLPQSTESENAVITAPVHYLADESQDPAARVEQERDGLEQQNQLKDALKALDERSRDIVQQRWLQDNKQTLHQLADKYNVSAERIRQLENNAMKKLKQHLLPATI
ncbi:MAG: RNA polymerase sigma factor RpoH [Pseudomonadota bacterium]